MIDLKKIDMSVFVGRDFDCEVKYGLSEWMVRSEVDFEQEPNGAIWRPRLNKAQVLGGYSWLPDGFVIDCRFFYGNYSVVTKRIRTSFIRDFPDIFANSIEWVSIIGLEEGYELEGMEVYRGDE